MSLLATISLLVLTVGVQIPKPNAEGQASADDRIRELIASLPPGSIWRNMMEHGAKGDGIRQPWMDEMRDRGIRLAVLTFEFDWAHGGEGLKNLSNWRLVSANYFTEYDYRSSQPIADPRRLAAIRASGLERTLESVALVRAKTGFWVEDPWHQHPPRPTGTGFIPVLLADNPWLPVQMFPWFGQYEPGTTPLMHAAMLGDIARVMELLARGARVNATSLDGSTALIYAATSGSPVCVRALLEAGADVNASMKGGGNALTAAVVADHVDVVRLLLKAGADPNSRNPEGQSALQIATNNSNAEIAKLLRQAGARE